MCALATVERFATRLGSGIVVLTLAACANPSLDEHDSPSPSAVDAKDAFVAVHNTQDLMFARHTLTSWSETTRVTAMAQAATANRALLDVAEQIVARQQSDWRAATAFLLQWGQDPHAGNGSAGDVPGIHQNTIETLRAQRDARFDKLWLQTMISHSQAEIGTALHEVSDGENPDAVALAKSVTAERQADVDSLQELLSH